MTFVVAKGKEELDRRDIRSPISPLLDYLKAHAPAGDASSRCVASRCVATPTTQGCGVRERGFRSAARRAGPTTENQRKPAYQRCARALAMGGKHPPSDPEPDFQLYGAFQKSDG